jgi:quinol monooxygenase YgiN
MITIIAKWTIIPEHREFVMERLRAMIKESRQEPGNLRYDLFRMDANQDEVLLHEEYESPEAFQVHRDAPYFKKMVLEECLPKLSKRSMTIFGEPLEKR